MSDAPPSIRPGDLGDVDRADLVELAAVARRIHDWAPLADRLVRLRLWGVPVATLSVVVELDPVSRTVRVGCQAAVVSAAVGFMVS